MKFRGAIAGFGNIAVNGHLPGYRENGKAAIVAVMDVMSEAEGFCRTHLPDAAFYTDLDDLLRNEDVDFVDIATPPGTHAANILKVLEHGRHVLCEKPLVLKSSDFAQIAALSKEKRCVVYTVHNWRYAPIFMEASRLVSKGKIGTVRSIEYRVIRTRPSVTSGETGVEDNWRIDPAIAGGGILVDHGWHAFYMVSQWAGGDPSYVECRLENRKFTDIPLEDTAVVTVGYENGVRASLFFTWAGESRANSVVIRGSRGELLVDDDRIVLDTGGEKRNITFPQALSQGSHHPEWYSAVFEDFFSEIVDSSLAGKNLREAGWCQIMMEKCAESDAEGRRIEFPQNVGA